MLELHLMGNPQILLDGRAVRPKTQKMLLLLAVLALEGRVFRERLANLLWTDSRDAKNSLRNALSGLRYQYGNHLQTNRAEVWLEQTQCDAQKILGGSLETVLQSQGNLLESFTPESPEAEDWLFQTRAQVLATALRLLTNATPSQTVLEKWAQLEPLSELAHQNLIRFFAAQGERTRALAVFNAFKARLKHELGEIPSPETLALADGLQLAPKVAKRLPSLPALLLESRLVGRVQEFQRLVAAFHQSAQGMAQMVVLLGEPGIGKTRLAQEFLAWSGLRSARTLAARAFEGGGLAYQAIADSLRRIPALETRLSKVWLAELARLLPELLEFDLPPPVLEEALGRSRVFEAVARLIGGLGHVVWWLDDLQWADSTSLEVLNFVLRRAAQDKQPLLLVATLRSEAHQALQPWLGGLAITPQILQLEALSKEETARLLEDIGVDSGALLEWLFLETNGQPLFIAETLRGLTETGVLRQNATGWDVQLESPQPLAPGVRAVIEARFARLPPEARLLLEVGAVLGQGFSFADALVVAQQPENLLLEALEACLRARVLLELPTVGLGVVRYAFSHDKLHETALLRLSAPRLQALHRLALERPHASAAQKAFHAFGARAWQQAVYFSFAAAEAASKTYAWQDAHAHLERARQILRESPDNMPAGAGLGSKRLLEFFQLGSDLNVTLNRFEDNLHLAQEAVRLSREIPDRELEAAGLLFTAGSYGFNNPTEVAKLREQARVILLETQNAHGLYHLAVTGVDTRLGDSAIQQLKDLLPQAEALQNGNDVWLLATIASTTQAVGRWQEAIFYWNSTLERQNIPLESDICAYRIENLAFCYTNSGQLEQAIQHGREAVRIKRAIDDNKSFLGMALVYLAYALLEAGENTEAQQLCEEAYSYRKEALPRMAAEYCFALAWVQLEQGLFSQSIPLLKEAQAILATLSESEFEVLGAAYQNYLESHLCAAYAGLLEWEKAAYHAKKAVLIRETHQDWRGVHAPKLHHWLETKALQHIGETAMVTLLVERLEAVALVGEPLEVNLILCKSNLATLPALRFSNTWQLRQHWLAKKKLLDV